MKRLELAASLGSCSKTGQVDWKALAAEQFAGLLSESVDDQASEDEGVVGSASIDEPSLGAFVADPQSQPAMAQPARSQRARLEQAECVDHAWRDALDHQRTCLACRTAAIAAEPTVLFQRLPSIELSEAEVEVMRERVAGVRRGREVARGRVSASGSGGQTLDRSNSRGRLQRWAGAAAVLAIAITGSLGVGLSPGVAAGLTAADEAALEASLGALPLVEGVESYGTDQSVLVQGLMRSASGDLDFAWVADGALEP